MRKPCYDCCLKHLGKAAVLSSEMMLGYPGHYMFIIGNLSEAEDEIFGFSPELAADIRDVRLKLMDDMNYDIVPECLELFDRCLGLKLASIEESKTKKGVLP